MSSDVATETPEVITPPEVDAAASAGTALTVVSGRAVDLWKDTASTFVPSLKADLTSDERRKAVREVAAQAMAVDDRLNLVLGEMLYEASQNNYWKNWMSLVSEKNFLTFEQYCEEELQLKKSKAHYLKAIYKVFVVDLDLPVEKLRELEWSKAKELRHVITPENADELIDKIKQMPVSEVKGLVRQMSGKTTAATAPNSQPGEDKIRVPFLCSPDQAESIQAALSVAQSMTGSEVPANNLDLICTDFMAGVTGSGLEGVTGRLDVIVKSVERAFGVNLSITGHDAERYGKLAKESDDATSVDPVESGAGKPEEAPADTGISA